VTQSKADPRPDEPTGWLGVDLGIVNLATVSDGETHSGKAVETKRQWYANRRAALQKVGTKSAKRHLKRLAGRQKRFQKDTNHVISKRLVACGHASPADYNAAKNIEWAAVNQPMVSTFG
jgi:transposase